MRRIAATGLLAVAVLSAPVAVADPAAEPVPPVPPPVLQLGPLGPLAQPAPVTLLSPETYRMPDGEQPSPYVLTQGAAPGPFAFINGLKGVHALLHGAMGRMPGDELGAALPGTAPPPGTALPPGLEEFLPEGPPATVAAVPPAPGAPAPAG